MTKKIAMLSNKSMFGNRFLFSILLTSYCLHNTYYVEVRLTIESKGRFIVSRGAEVDIAPAGLLLGKVLLCSAKRRTKSVIAQEKSLGNMARAFSHQ